MNKEVRAVVLGLMVVVIFALALAAWRGPSRDFHRLRGFRVEVKKSEGDETRKFSVHVPVALLAQLTRLANIDNALDGEIRANWDSSDVTPRQILDAADSSTADQPGIIKHEDTTIEVRKRDDVVLIDVKDGWDQKVHIEVPRYVVDVFAADQPLSARELLHRLDELQPGDHVTIRDRNDEVTITAEAKRKGIIVD